MPTASNKCVLLFIFLLIAKWFYTAKTKKVRQKPGKRNIFLTFSLSVLGLAQENQLQWVSPSRSKL